MDLTTLWIGDEVKILSSGKTGFFEGMEAGKAKVRIDGGHSLHAAHDLVLYEAPEEDDLLEILEITPVKVKQKDVPFSNILDLHLEKLPNYSPGSGISILDYQIKKCKEFIEEVIRRKLLSATIIHGRGTGILREQILVLLSAYKQIKIQHPKNEGGAIEVLLFY
ncbi:MAG: hypothetical protein HKN76_15205 [Saprospiraceae bacterium]|nr:hypothetical protein [Saprospiraceae bacterium]